MDYTKKDIKAAYEQIGIGKKRTVMLRIDLRWLGRFESYKKEDIVCAHFDVLSDLMDFSESTLVVSTASMTLCNTSTPFDPNNIPSEMGVLTEYIRTRKEAVRSFHPFVSYTAIGKDSEKICSDVARHAFGPETPKSRMIESNALCVSVGTHPRFTCTTVHHIEFLMGVPYRYVKEFFHPVVRNGKTVIEPFYLYVWYRDCDLKRNLNVKIFERFLRSGYDINEARLGKGKVYSYSMADFYLSTVKAFKENIYIWLDEPPVTRPYLK